MSFRLSSPNFGDGQQLPLQQANNGFGHDGGNISPHLLWEHVPEGTKSFVVTCFDPDAPTGSGWWHWVVANIPGDIRELSLNAGADGTSLPKGAIHIRNDFGTFDYGGAAPPPGPAHRYIFSVHALSVDKVDISPAPSAAFIGFNVHFAGIGTATLTALF